MICIRVPRAFYYLAAVYVAVSLVYTTTSHFLQLHRALTTYYGRTFFSGSLSWLAPGHPETPTPLARTHQELIHGIPSGTVYWNSSTRGPNAAASEDLFLSKAFSTSMRPSKIIPYFYRASDRPAANDVTITTLITSNRFHVFSRLVERYRGPISVAIHVKNVTSHVDELLASLHTLYASSPLMAQHVDVHLIVDAFDRQFNTWRNVARFFARTDYVMMLDIDFSVCTDFRRVIRFTPDLRQRLDSGVALVIPAFEYSNLDEGTNQDVFPRTKEALLNLVNVGRIGMFHASWQPGHNSTDYGKYYVSSPGEVYEVTHYQPSYEPYIVMRKDGPPWCDERFVGYGGNKAACLFEIYLSGVSFQVLADHFIIHQNHLYEETIRKNERKYNRKLYAEFKEEACLKYLKVYADAGILHAERGRNAREQCVRIRSIARVAGQIIESSQGLGSLQD
ncbi:glycosyltransferase family 49 protein [Schizophyllum amplum]|uniref:Glycosyltransferase family 49 protein n=1 Tax=Schizophyllum amplum TaxID=97359 RepID=A0A550CWJ7_9AGAR|nr:glycosyltransferase family 49 protein [Auriculariopsis ampla]